VLTVLLDTNAYDLQMINALALGNISEQQINDELERYFWRYAKSFERAPQRKYFEATIRGLLSGLDRKSIEPIALHFLGQSKVRGMQQFFKRSKGWQENLTQRYQTQLSRQLTSPDGFASIDESDFVKKGTNSAGVARQYCGRVGKRENCQSGVFLSYASEKGYGLLEAKLYIPKHWFDKDYTEKRETCHIPKTTTFQTKNQMAIEMLNKKITDPQFPIKWVGCDSTFGCDHSFLDGLPQSVHYFASVKEDEYIFLTMPKMGIPLPKRGPQSKQPRALEAPVCIASLGSEEAICWERRTLAQGTKGPLIADIKCVRAFSCRRINNNLFVPGVPIWVYIRRYEDGTLKYFISNAPEDTEQGVLDRLATMRWSIEQCFLECKSYLGMGHYEARSYQAWHRHMLLVMVAHLFTSVLRGYFKKRVFF